MSGCSIDGCADPVERADLLVTDVAGRTIGRVESDGTARRARSRAHARVGRPGRARRCLAAGLIALLQAVAPISHPAAALPPGGPGGARPAVDELAILEAGTDGRLRSVVDETTGLVTFLGSDPDHPLAAASPPGGGRDPVGAARSFLDAHADLLLANPDHHRFEVASVARTAAGGHAVRFTQTTGGVPVLAGHVVVRLAADGSVMSVAGQTSAGVPSERAAAIEPGEAAETALSLAAGELADPAAAEIVVETPELMVYDPALLERSGRAALVWSTSARDPATTVEHRVLVDAASGDVLLDVAEVAAARDRRVCDDANIAANPELCATSGPLVARTEGQPATGDPEVDMAYDLAGVTYDFYAAVLQRDSIDDAGMPLVSTVRYCESPGPLDCPADGAYWNGTQMVYGEGWASADDIVGHEFTHGFIERTSDLLMYGESGAIAESIADVIGELIDQQSTVGGPDPPAARWLIGEQSPGGAIRDMRHPATFDDPDRMSSPRYAGGPADAHGIHTNSGVGNKAAYLITDGTAGEAGGVFNGQVIDGIGAVKTARLYAEVTTSLLGPGSDYADLFVALPQACSNLFGAGGMTTSDCQQVTKAVTATEMDRAPSTPGSRLTAPVCDTGHVVTTRLFEDDMEAAALPNWHRPVPTTPAGRWTSAIGSSASGTRSMHAPNLPEALTAEAALAASVLIPSGTSTYLRFAHSYSMEADVTTPPYAYYDGGVVEYTTNNGAQWHDAALLPGTVNGYPGGAVIAAGGDNPLQGDPVFSGTTPGYVQTRIDLSSLDGESVKIRFRVGTDGTTARDGWFIDDVAIYSCAPPSEPDAPASVGAVGGHQAATLDWAAPVSDGGAVITHYVITPSRGGVPQPAVVTPDATTSFQVTGLTNFETYTFTVVAVNSVGASLPSPPSNAVVPAPGPPWQPTGVAAVRGDLSATVSWMTPGSDGGSTITGYVITPYIGSTAQTAISRPAAPNSTTIHGLLNGTTYTFRVSAVNSSGTGPPSAASNTVTPAGVPDPPTALNPFPGQLAASISWTAPAWSNGSPVTAYVITPYIGATAQTPVTTPDATPAYTVTGLLYGVGYTFRIAAANAVGTGPQSAASAAVVPLAQLAAAPSAASAQRGDRSAALTWSAPAWDGGAPISAYVVTPFIGSAAQAPVTTPTNATSFAVTGLTNGAAYTFTVAAVNAAGTGPASSASGVVVPAGAPDPPTSVVAVQRHRSADLSWAQPSFVNGAPVSAYVITPYRSGIAQPSITTASPVESATVTGLTNGQPYTFTVAAINAAGQSGPSALSTVVIPVGPPEPPTSVTGTRGDGTVALQWIGPADTGGRPILNYVITPYVDGVPRTPTITPSSATAFGLSGLSNGTQYTFRIAAVNSVGTGPESTDVVVLTPAGSPGAPQQVTALAGNGTALLSWRPPAADGGAAISGYLVTTYLDGVPIATAEAPSTAGSLSVTGLDRRKRYTFDVTARNATGLGTPSGQTAPLQPTRSGFTAAGPDRVFDTRPGESPEARRQVPKVKVGGTEVLEVKVTDLPGLVPSSGVGAVSLNVVATGASAGGFVTVFPCGERKLVASVNYGPGQTVANAVVAPVSAAGTVCFYSLSPADLIVDLNGWFAADSNFAAVGPDRVFDTRPGESPGALRTVTKGKVGGADVLQVQMTDLGGLVPASNVGAVSINVAVTNPAAAGFVTVYPCGERKLVASVNFLAGQTVANAVIAPVSASGAVCFYSLAPTDLIVDINGWFAAGSDFTAVGPDRVLDTRPGESPGALRAVEKSKVGGDRVLQVSVAGLPGVTPEAGIGAVSLNVAVTNPAAAGFVTVFPCGERKLVASVNYAAAQTVANAVIAPVSPSGTVCFYSMAPTDLIVDINGWFPTTG